MFIFVLLCSLYSDRFKMSLAGILAVYMLSFWGYTLWVGGRIKLKYQLHFLHAVNVNLGIVF